MRFMAAGWAGCAVIGFCLAAAGQVAATHPFHNEMERALELEAGTRATDLPLHVHYDLKLYNHKGKLTTGTWDIWSDPLHYERVDIKAGDFQYTHIEDLVAKKQWRHFNTFMPLKIFDLRENYRAPLYLVERFDTPKPMQYVRFEQVDGMPFDCTNEVLQMRICFDPIAHVLAFAQVLNQSMTWENWQPVGVHSVPRRFRIYDAGRVMVEAVGQATVVKTFPADLFAIPVNEPDMGEPELDGSIPHKLIQMKPEQLQPVYGNALVEATVGVDGKVKKAKLIDADDDDIIGDTMHSVKHMTFAPQIKDGVPTPFVTYLYLAHAPFGK
jgi:hypothetical protein